MTDNRSRHSRPDGMPSPHQAPSNTGPQGAGPRAPTVGFVEDDLYGGTIATNPNQPPPNVDTLPFRTPKETTSIGAKEPWAPQSPPSASWPATPSAVPWDSRATGPAVAQPVALAPMNAMQAPMAPPLSSPPRVTQEPIRHESRNAAGWGGGQASAFVPVPPLVVPPREIQRRPEAELRRAAMEGASAASDAAAFALASPKANVVEAPLTPSAPSAPRERVELIGLERNELDKVRSSKILRAKAPSTAVGEDDEWISPSDSPIGGEVADRAYAHRTLAYGAISEPDSLETLLYEAFDDAKGAWPVALVAGELTIALDEIESFRALRAYAGAWANRDDKKLADALENADHLLQSALPPPADALHIARARVDDALRSANRPGIRDLEPMLERSLIEARSFTRRSVMGARRVLAHIQTGTAALPVYIGESMALELPLFRRFAAHVVVEIRSQQDATEAHPLALRAIVLGRVIAHSRGRAAASAARTR